MQTLETTHIDVADLMEQMYGDTESHDDREEYREVFYERLAERHNLR